MHSVDVHSVVRKMEECSTEELVPETSPNMLFFLDCFQKMSTFTDFVKEFVLNLDAACVKEFQEDCDNDQTAGLHHRMRRSIQSVS